MATDTYTSSQTMPSWVQPFASGYLDRAQNVADQAYQPYTGATIAGFNPFQTSAFQGIADRASAGNPAMNAANGALTNTIQGGFLQGNPFLQNQIDAAQGDLTKQWNNVAKPAWDTAMSNSGSFGNAGVAQANAYAQEGLQKNLGQISSNMRFQNYDQERNRQMQAMGMAPSFANQDYQDLNALQGVGNTIQGQDQKMLTDQYNRFLDSKNYPNQQLDVMRNALSGVNFGSNTTQTAPGTSTGASLVGGALTGASLWKMLFGGP
jgi:hypothetical protein